ncbi:MAG: hypothetical protein N2688_14770 [Burkholderiaceae bacterium]|nr:hypothetical protein [Burkholderiaceae bacterium]
MPEGPPPRPPPAWLSPAALAAAREARHVPGAFPRPGEASSKAVRETILAHHSALPLTMIAEAVRFVVGSE